MLEGTYRLCRGHGARCAGMELALLGGGDGVHVPESAAHVAHDGLGIGFFRVTLN